MAYINREIEEKINKFIKRYKPEKGLIITLNEFEIKYIYNTKVYTIPAYYI
ncbi:MAG: hypothetical protein ACO2OX_00190 [Candidatus Nanopusillus sp.]